MIQRTKPVILSRKQLPAVSGFIVFAYFISLQISCKADIFHGAFIAGNYNWRNLQSASDLGKIIGKNNPPRDLLLFAASGVAIGSILQSGTWSHLDIELFPRDQLILLHLLLQ